MLYATLIILIIVLRAMINIRNSRAHGVATKTSRAVIPHGGRREYRARANALEGR